MSELWVILCVTAGGIGLFSLLLLFAVALGRVARDADAWAHAILVKRQEERVAALERMWDAPARDPRRAAR